VNISDDFGGSIYTPGDILIVRQTAGIFTGSLQAGGAITSALLSGSLNEGGRIVAGDYFNYISVAGNVDGRIAAQQLRTVSVSGNVLDDGTLQSTSDLWTLLVGGTFAGSGVFDGARLINLTGAITATGSLSSTGDVTSVLLRGGMNAGSSLMIEGMANVINAGGTISGLIAVQGGANVAMVTNVTNGLIVIAENTRMFRAMGDVNDSVISFGTWIGSDGAYNTADDSITGGSVVYANIVGDFLNSALVAGVLPNVNYGPGLPADIADAYYGSEDRTTLDETDAAEAGGIFLSEFTTVVFGDDIQDFLGGGGQSVLAAADGIGRILTYAPIGSLLTRTYNDPYLAPTVQVNKTDLLDTNNLFVYFSEELASGSLSLSQDNNNDGDLTDPGDVQGSVTLRDMSDNILDEDVTLYYYATEDDDGQSVGLLQIVGTDLFTQDIRLTLSGSLTGPAIYDRSGMRSALRDYNQDGVESPGEDIWQTILDGEGDGTEGGDYSVVISVVDRANTFEAALEAGPITLQVDGVTQLQSKFSSSEDIDIFYFTGTEFEYFSSAFTSFSGVQAALFYQDTQGTATLDDDFYELVARYERTSYYGDLANFQAWELHATGNYFLVLAPDGFSAEVSYSLDLTYGTTDTNLVSLLPGGSLPTGEQIAYVSSTVGEHNNNLGALEKKQLVYLNFEGGTADKYDVGDVSIDELDLADIDVTLDGQEDTLINGGVYDGQTITGIVDLVLDVYENTAASYLDAQGQPRNLNVDRITTLAEWTAGTEGLYFTTVDPATWGLDPDADYTTCFVGDADDSVFGASLYGIASTVDWTNVSKADNAITFAQNFQGLAAAATAAGRLQQYARALANTTAHELGHVLGLNHQPTTYETDSWILLPDDPDNDPNTPDDSNSGAGLMAYATSDVKISVLLELGTNVITSREFPTGWIDTQDLVMRWLTT
jgi:hypothetical protein